MKKIASFFVFILACLILLLGVTPLFFVGRVTEIVEKQCDENLEASVDFSDLSLNLFRHFPQLTVTLTGLQVTGVDTFRQDTLVRAEKIRLVVNLASILTEEGVTIKQIDLVKPAVNGIVLKDGRANWNITKADTSQQTEGDTSAVSIALKKITIEDAHIVYDDRQSGMVAVIDRWTGTLKGNLSSKRTRIETSSLINAVSFQYGGINYVEKLNLDADVAVEADFEQSRYELSTNRILLNEIPLSFNGYVQLPDTSTIRMDVALDAKEVTFKQLLSLVPALYKNKFKSLRASGDLKLSASIKGDWTGDDYPAFNLGVSVKQGTINYPGLPASITDVFVDARLNHTPGSLDKTTFSVNRFHLSMAGQPIDATLHLATPLSDPAVEASLKGTLNLASVKTVYPLEEGQDLKGTLHADIHVAGRLSCVEKKRYNEIKASGGASAKAIQYKQAEGNPIQIDNAALALTPAAVKLESFNLKWGRNDLSASGLLENYLLWLMDKGVLAGQLEIASSYLNLNDLMADVSKQSDTPDAKTSTAESDTSQLTAIDVPTTMNLALKARVGTLTFSKLVLEQFNGSLLVKDGLIVMDNIKANSMGGTLGVDGYYTMVTKNHPLVDLALQLMDVSYGKTANSLSMIQELAPIFNKIQGTYSMNLKLNATMDNHYKPLMDKLSAQGRLQSNNLKISGVKVLDLLATTLKQPSLSSWSPKNVDVAFTVNDGRIKTAPFAVKVQDVNLLFEGSSGIDKTLNYAVKATLPERLAVQGLSVVNGSIVGTFDKPAIKMDMAGLARQAAKGVANNMVKQLTGGTIDQQVTKAKDALEKQATQLRAQAKTAGEKLIAEAGKEGDKLIEKAGNPVLKLAAKTAADGLKAKARERAATLEAEAEEKIKAMYKEQGLTP